MYSEDEYLALSGIQHFAFCRRQWALIHIEQIWQDNLLTVEGIFMHERAHNEAIREKRGDIITVRGLGVRSSRLGIVGLCDVVEFHQSENGHPLVGEDGRWTGLPIEYKHGRSKTSDADRLQLCAEGMCLEEMLGSDIEYGCLYYGATHSRERVEFDETLRTTVEVLYEEMHSLYAKRYVPKVRQFAACRSCSLFVRCMPRISNRSVSSYIDRSLRDVL